MKQTKKPTPIPSKDGQHLTRIGVSFGLTVNLGEYESARIDAWEEAVTTEADKAKSYSRLWKSVNDQVGKEVELINSLTAEDEDDPPKKKSKKKRR